MSCSNAMCRSHKTVRRPQARRVRYFAPTVDKFGERKQFNKDIYNLLYVDDAEIENAEYMVFECPLPRAFTETVGDMEMVFTYSEINSENKAATRLASGIYKTNVGDSDVSDGATVDPVGGELARLNDITVKVEQLEDSIDALLQPPDNSDADKVGKPNVSLTESGRLKFDELKGEKGDTGEISVGSVKTVQYDKFATVKNSGTDTDAVLDFEIPQGKPAFIKIGKVITLPPNTEARVINVGTENDPIFDFYIPEGVGFRISKTYSSIAEMNTGYATDDVPLYGFVTINTGNVDDPENAMLFMKTPTKYEYLTDLSGAQGIKGDKGDKGDTGDPGILLSVPTGFFRVEVRPDGHLWLVSPDIEESPMHIDRDEESPTYGHLIIKF